jgi:hypothetical protein
MEGVRPSAGAALALTSKRERIGQALRGLLQQGGRVAGASGRVAGAPGCTAAAWCAAGAASAQRGRIVLRAPWNGGDVCLSGPHRGDLQEPSRARVC